MRVNYYERSPQRINPEFVGIASKYSQHKRKRLSFEHRRRELDSDVKYATKVDEALEKTLESKLGELAKLQQARQRHLDHLRYKQQMEEKRRAELLALKEKNTQSRIATKQHIQEARSSIHQRNRSNKQQLQLDLSRLSQRFELFLQSRLHQNTSKYQQINQEKRAAKQRVDSFHRERNNESLNTYLSKIHREKALRKEHHRRIKRHERALQELSKTVDIKKHCLQQVQEEIKKYRTDLKTLSPQASRKHSDPTKSDSRFIPVEYTAISAHKEELDL